MERGGFTPPALGSPEQPEQEEESKKHMPAGLDTYPIQATIGRSNRWTSLSSENYHESICVRVFLVGR